MSAENRLVTRVMYLFEAEKMPLYKIAREVNISAEEVNVIVCSKIARSIAEIV